MLLQVRISSDKYFSVLTPAGKSEKTLFTLNFLGFLVGGLDFLTARCCVTEVLGRLKIRFIEQPTATPTSSDMQS